MILRAILAHDAIKVVLWHHVPDMSKVMTQTKRDTLVLQVGGWA